MDARPGSDIRGMRAARRGNACSLARPGQPQTVRRGRKLETRARRIDSRARPGERDADVVLLGDRHVEARSARGLTDVRAPALTALLGTRTTVSAEVRCPEPLRVRRRTEGLVEQGKVSVHIVGAQRFGAGEAEERRRARELLARRVEPDCDDVQWRACKALTVAEEQDGDRGPNQVRKRGVVGASVLFPRFVGEAAKTLPHCVDLDWAQLLASSAIAARAALT